MPEPDMVEKEKNKNENRTALFWDNVLFIMFFLQGVQIPCPKEHTAIPDKLPEKFSARLRKQGLYLFLRKPQLDMRYLILQLSADTNKT